MAHVPLIGGGQSNATRCPRWARLGPSAVATCAPLGPCLGDKEQGNAQGTRYLSAPASSRDRRLPPRPPHLPPMHTQARLSAAPSPRPRRPPTRARPSATRRRKRGGHVHTCRIPRAILARGPCSPYVYRSNFNERAPKGIQGRGGHRWESEGATLVRGWPCNSSLRQAYGRA